MPSRTNRQLPEASYIVSLVDDFGIWEHADTDGIMSEEGYALDDAARGFLYFISRGLERESGVLFDYMQRSCTKERIYNFASADKTFDENRASEDSAAQVIWAMGLAISLGFRVQQAKKVLDLIYMNYPVMKYIRGEAYALLGELYFDTHKASLRATDITRRIHQTKYAWPWPERFLTYGNAIIPYALLRFSQIAGTNQFRDVGSRTLDFLDTQCHYHDLPAPIGNQHWKRDTDAEGPLFSQQPLDAAYMVMAWSCLAEQTHSLEHTNKAEEWLSWFDGHNVTGKKLIGPGHRCYDGIDDFDRISTSAGAESTICYLLAKLAIEKILV